MIREAWKELKTLLTEMNKDYKIKNPLDQIPSILLRTVESNPRFIEIMLHQKLDSAGVDPSKILELLDDENNRNAFINMTSEQRERLWSCIRTGCLIVKSMKF